MMGKPYNFTIAKMRGSIQILQLAKNSNFIVFQGKRVVSLHKIQFEK